MRVLTLAFDDLPPRTAYDVWRLRQQVFVVEQDCPYPDLDGRDLEEATRHVVLLDEDDASSWPRRRAVAVWRPCSWTRRWPCAATARCASTPRPG